MQELVLVQPGRTVGRLTAAHDNDRLTAAHDKEEELEHGTAQAETRREFEERLAECGPLAYRVARGVLRNTADAEDVAQEALLRAYRRFDRLRDRTRFERGSFALRFGSHSIVCVPGNVVNCATRFGRNRNTTRLPRTPKTSPLRMSSRRISIMP